MKKASQVVQRAPEPPAIPLRDGKFPKVYRNNEGPRDNPTHNFEAWEIQRQGADGRLFEYPVKPPEGDRRLPGRLPEQQPPPLNPDFRFARPPAGLNQIRPPHQNDKKTLESRWDRPPNDPGPIRAVVNGSGNVVGAIYHPEGNPRGYERARLAPLDKQGRGQRARHDDRFLAPTPRTTWPERGPQ